jgi:hypothetical protein
LRREHHVTQSMLVEGKLRVRIHRTSGEMPPDFSVVQATLEDAYLVLTGARPKAPETNGRVPVGAGSAR